jgi:putative iron-regulated protein
LRPPRRLSEAATDLLVTDLQEMAANWAEGGAARAA